MSNLQNLQILNYDEALSRLMGDEEILLIVYAEYYRTVPSQLTDLYKGIAENDNELTVRSAHSIKGASLNIGAEIVAHYALALEIAAKAEEAEKYDELAKAIEQAIADAQVAIKKYL